MSKANLCSEGETSPYNIYKFSGKILKYDAESRKIKTVLADNSETTTEFIIENGCSVIATTDPLGNITEIEKDTRDNVKRVMKLNSNKELLTQTGYEYSDMRELLCVTDAKSNKITSQYDMLGRRLTLESADFGKKEWIYDNRGRLIEESDSVLRENSQSIRYYYDGFSRVVKKDYPTIDDTTYTYGLSNELGFAGRLKKRSDASGVIEYEYGKLGETIKETRSLNKHFIYYTQYQDTITAKMSYKSNYLGQIEEIIYPNGEILQYIYDKAGQVEKVTGIIDGQEKIYVSNIGYDEYSQRNFIEYGNGVKTNYTYDPQRRWLKDLYSDNNNGQTLQNLKYSFDSVGNVLSYTNDCSLSGFNKTEQYYTYDNLYQLIKAEGTVSYQETSGDYKNFKSNYTQIFEYDSIGNLVKKTSRGTELELKFNQDPLNYTQDYIYDSDYAHRLKSINNQTFFLYDKNGNIIETSDESYEPKYDPQFSSFLNSQGATIYTFKYDPVTGDAPLVPRKPNRVNRRNFNERNMMIESSGIMEDTVNYSYDEDNKRTHKDNTSDDKYSLTFNDYYSIYFAHRNRTGEHYNNIMLGSTRLAIEIFNKENAINPNRTYFFHSDHLGSNTLITDTNGDIFQYTEYTPYGEVWAEVTQNKTWEYFYFNASYRFTGKPRDEETGYYYFGARYFDPRLNIWTSSDPAMAEYFDDSSKGEGGVFNHINLNAYHYAGNNPIKYVDPDGNSVVIAAGTGVAYGLLALGALLCIKPAIQALDGLNAWIESYIPYRHNLNDNIEIYNPKNITSGKEELIPTNIGNNQEVLIPTALPPFKEIYEGQISLPTIFTSNKLAPTYPPNNGVMGGTERHFLMPGDRIDRFGYPTGTYFSPTGTPLDMRSLPPGVDLSIYSKFIVQKPFEVDKSLIAPHNGHFGFGTQYKSPVSAEVLIDKGIIKNED